MTRSRNDSHHAIETPDAPAPVGPDSQAIVLGDLVFASGQIPLDPETGQRIGDDIEAQVQQVLANLAAVLEAAGSGLDNVLKTTVFLTDLTLFPKVNALYAEAFTADPAPARSTIEVSALPLGALVEIEDIARVRSNA